MHRTFLPTSEWLETDGLGGFASGTVGLARTRRYHALLLAATTPPTGRFVLVNGLEVWLECNGETIPLSSQRYHPDVTHPDGASRITEFSPDPWPHWTFALEDGTRIEHELFAVKGFPTVALRWTAKTSRQSMQLCVRPLLSGRDYHSMQHANAGFRFDADVNGEKIVWRPYDGVPAVVALANAHYSPSPDWYRSFQYDEERARCLDFLEDLASPGVLRFDLWREDAMLIFSTDENLGGGLNALNYFDQIRTAELKRRKDFPSRLHRAADDYVVKRGSGKTIVAGYPWFTDWGRDTFIALRGICLATGRFDDARDILVEWAGVVSEGMLPNRFPDRGEQPEFNSVDASLWYIIAVHDFLAIGSISTAESQKLRTAVLAILKGYSGGTRHGIRVDRDGLLVAGDPGVQLTWMDAKVGDWVVTPRIGKPVEIQALWLNALRIGAVFSSKFAEMYERGRTSFESRFWNEQGGYLYDVVDCNDEPGKVDASFRPNQVLAVGGLTHILVTPEKARRVVDAVENRLLTPLGLRSLAPGEPDYQPRYEGSVWQRDGAYHQGTVWPWLLGPFVEAWVRARGDTAAAKREARERFLDPLLAHLDAAGISHLCEIADAEPPHTPRGCPWQAWSVGEALRLDQIVLAPCKETRTRSDA